MSFLIYTYYFWLANTFIYNDKELRHRANRKELKRTENSLSAQRIDFCFFKRRLLIVVNTSHDTVWQAYLPVLLAFTNIIIRATTSFAVAERVLHAKRRSFSNDLTAILGERD